ncbi:non-ribosomal peptide synthetase [Streptomyces sp. NBC_01294]|uniref:non-ribosomal peptide synthetase n=1 Tax=Streptomyces sp. NBC_01294 TaxID=2903815 RepID=UPI002DDA5955|nr:non-ribosomal peptide synthetase [Streptomyces sp. NBC_01294]WRZ62220.1 amino acid adenylation domain-containing protein [Streptomyces sp. NBC_01294]
MTIQSNPADRYHPFSLTEVQESFYVGRTAGGHAGGTQIHLEFEADRLDPARLRESWNRCVADTDMLRAHLLPDARQAVLEQAPEYQFEIRDLTAVGRDEQRASLEQMRRQSAAAIDPHRWPLFAVAAAELPGGRTRVMLTVEELIADGPSVSLLVQDWYARYAFGEEPGVPEISFRDYALATGGRRPSEESLAYWRDKLGAVDFGRPLPLARPDADPAAAADGEHRRMTLHLDREQWERAKEAAREARATPSAMLLALNAAAVGTAGSGPLPLVLTTYNRLPLHADVARLVGPFLSTSVFVAPEAAGTMGELVSEVSGQLWRDLEHGDVSGVRALRERARIEPGRRAVPVPVVFTSLLGSITDQRAADPGNWAALVDVDESATRTPGVQLEMCVQERAGQLHVSWDYLPGALDGAEVRAAFERLGALLRRVAELGPAVWNTDLPTTIAPDAGTETVSQASFGTAGRLPLTEVQSAYLVGRLGTLGGATETRVYQEFLLENHDADTLEAAWNRLVAHHPMLRAAVHQDGTLEVVPAVPHYRITRHDLTGLRPTEGPAADGGSPVERALADTAARLRGGTFPLGSRPMYALEASILPDGTTVLHVVLDALLADARSFAMLFGQLFALHDGDSSVLDEPADPGPYLRGLVAPGQDGPAEAARLAWREKFAALPGGPPLPDPAPQAARLHRRTDLGSWRRLTERAAAIGVPADMVLLTAYTDELRRTFGPEPFTVTVVSWDRPAGLAHADRMVADFTQLAWVVVDDTLPADFAQRARELWGRVRADLERGELRPGLAELRGRVFRSGGRLRLPVVFTRVPEIDPALHPRGVRLRESQSQTAQVALDHVPLLVGDDLVGQWDAAEGCLSADRLDTMFEGYTRRIRSFVESVESVESAGSAGSAGALSPTMTGLLAETLSRHPDRPAVHWDGRVVDYRELDHRTAQLAHQLIASGIRPGDHVAVHMNRSDDLVVALVGIVRAGAVYVPVDPANPPERVRYLLEDSGARVVVADAALAAVPAAAGAVVLCQDRDEDRALLASRPVTPPQVEVGPDDPVYTIYTSGTTGKPKGCRNTHRGFVNRVRWMQDRFPLGADDRVAQKTPYGFDVSAWEFFWPLLAGASIVVARPGGHVDPGYLARLLRDERVTVAHFVPSVLGLFLRDRAASDCASLRYVFASGEALPVATMKQFFQVLPGGAELHNLYGPTEAAIDVTHWACRPDWDEPTVPIGRPIARTRIHLVDERMARVPDGTPGEIVIGGAGVALGYHGRPELTAERFVASPFADDPSPRLYRTGDLGQLGPDGEIRYLGRIDSQFKLRGLRIEPEEVEAALTDLPGVSEARVLPVTDPATGEQILAAVCVEADGTLAPSVGQMRRDLARSLPPYLVPNSFRFVDRLPLTANGKLDRPAATALFDTTPPTAPAAPVPAAAALAPGAAAAAPAAPQAPALTGHPAPAIEEDPVYDPRPGRPEEGTAALVKAAVADCLRLEAVDLDADLFDLGATSFTMIRLAQEIERLTGVALSVDALISGPTVTALLAAIRAGQAADRTEPETAGTAAPTGPEADAAAVAGLAAGLLGLAEADPDTDLFDLGATSFTMIRLAQELAERFGADVPVDALIQTPTARGIAASLAPASSAPQVASARQAPAPAARTDIRIALDPQAKAAFKEARVAERRLPGSLARLPFPAAGPQDRRALYDASAFREFADGPLPGDRLTELLGTLARGELDGRAKHRYPSAGGFYPVQVYLYVRPGAVEGVEGGLYYLHPGERALVAIDPQARFGTDIHVFHNRALVDASAFGVFLVSTPAAIAPAYGERNAARFSMIEAGHVAQLLLTAAPERGLGMCAVGEMDFGAVRGHFGLQDDQELLVSLWGGALSGPALRRRAELVTAERPQESAPVPSGPRPVAVVGFAARLPGADDLRGLDAMLAAGDSALGPAPEERWAPLRSNARRAGARVGGYLADVTAVEVEEFGLADAEVAAVDPQERLLLTVTRHCLEDAALTPERLSETGQVGVFVGSMWQDHALYGVAARAEGQTGTHATRGGLAHRISHAFGLTGPSLVIDTGCVSGLAAVEAAFRAVADGRCEAAVAAGSNLVLHPDHLDVLSELGLVAEQEDSCAFTDRASGWLVGEGVGAVLLKPLDRALEDGDPVHAVLRGGALLHSGTTRQFGIPDPRRQEQVMRAALADARLTAGDIGYVEAAAAGAALADALEYTALGRLFGAAGADDGGANEAGNGARAGLGPVPVGSVKPNTGHLEAASVFAQLGKLIAQFRRDRLYPTRLTSAANPALASCGGSVALAGPSADRWRTAPGGTRRALVNGFAGGGSYGSLVVEEPPAAATAGPADADTGASEGIEVLVLSADSPENLARWARSLAEELDADPGLALAAVARTLREGRRARPVRGAVAADRGRAAGALRTLAERVLRDGTGATVEAARTTADQQALTAVWSAGGELPVPAAPATSAVPRRRALPPVPLSIRRVPLPVPAAAAPRPENGQQPDGPTGTGPTPFERMAGIVAQETGAVLDRLAPADDLFAMGVTSRQLLRIAARVAADGGSELPLESLFTAPDLAALAELAFPTAVPA